VRTLNRKRGLTHTVHEVGIVPEFFGGNRMAPSHELMGDKLHLYKRENSKFKQCSTYVNGRTGASVRRKKAANTRKTLQKTGTCR
jgi:hypothetical protein